MKYDVWFGVGLFHCREEGFEERKWRYSADNYLMKAVPPNMYKTIKESKAVVAYVIPRTKLSETNAMIGDWIGGYAMYLVCPSFVRVQRYDSAC